MPINYTALPVYEQKARILDTLSRNQVIVVQSPTGSGKTTQIPVILHEAGYSESGMIAVTQPRRIAALSVSEFIARQLNTSFPGLVGYKMRFEDKTDLSTRIKIMTDGILLQEMKLDPMLTRYSVIMVDEAHERSLNIDFVLGLLKRVLSARPSFKVIVSSATMNTEAFSLYFDGCPVVTIDTVTYPVHLVYDPPAVTPSSSAAAAAEALLSKIESTIERVLENNTEGDILCFLPGEKIIKDCMRRLAFSPFSQFLHLIPLYGRLAKEEQEQVFEQAPHGKKKVILSTNIAETSVTIDGITVVIDSGLAKLNHYNPRSFTSSLIESPVSKASCSQRRGRAGRTRPGICYRLYPRKDYDSRPLFTLEEIYRTDLSEVVLRMSELGITDFESFDFISPPGREGIIGAVETLKMLKALNNDNTLSSIGKLMVEFPLMPRQSRIIVEAILNAPDVLEEALIAAAFLSAQSPFVLPPGEEMEARRAHHSFRDIHGDFVSYVKLFRTYVSIKNTDKFCKNNYLDERVMAEIKNIKAQLEQIITDLGIPVTGGGSSDDYLCCIASGMIQFVCVREGREQYRSLTAEHIQIHPGSGLFRSDPLYIVAGEIVKTSRMFAMSVSPLTRNLLQKIDPALEENLESVRRRRSPHEERSSHSGEKTGARPAPADENTVLIGGTAFSIERINGKKILVLPWKTFRQALHNEKNQDRLSQLGNIRAKVVLDGCELLSGERLSLIIKLEEQIGLQPAPENRWNRNLTVRLSGEEEIRPLIDSLRFILQTAPVRLKSRTLGFISLHSDGRGAYWYKVTKNCMSALTESLASLETIIDDTSDALSASYRDELNAVYRRLNSLLEEL